MGFSSLFYDRFYLENGQDVVFYPSIRVGVSIFLLGLRMHTVIEDRQPLPGKESGAPP
jgi:hypothetical protein